MEKIHFFQQSDCQFSNLIYYRKTAKIEEYQSKSKLTCFARKKALVNGFFTNSNRLAGFNPYQPRNSFELGQKIKKIERHCNISHCPITMILK